MKAWAAMLLLVGVAQPGCASPRAGDAAASDSSSNTKPETLAESYIPDLRRMLRELADELPVAAAPAWERMRLVIPSQPSFVSDDFFFALWLDDDGQVWVVRQGGVMGTWRAYGPVEPEDGRTRAIIEHWSSQLAEVDRDDSPPAD